MFRLAKPKFEDIHREVEKASRLVIMPAEFLASSAGLKVNRWPSGFAHDLVCPRIPSPTARDCRGKGLNADRVLPYQVPIRDLCSSLLTS